MIETDKEKDKEKYQGSVITWFSEGLVARQGKVAGVWPALYIYTTYSTTEFPIFHAGSLQQGRKLPGVRTVLVTTALPVPRIVHLTGYLILIILCDLEFNLGLCCHKKLNATIRTVDGLKRMKIQFSQALSVTFHIVQCYTTNKIFIHIMPSNPENTH